VKAAEQGMGLIFVLLNFGTHVLGELSAVVPRPIAVISHAGKVFSKC
jgi:hypothetical protein